MDLGPNFEVISWGVAPVARAPFRGVGVLPPQVWRAAQCQAAPDLNSPTLPGAWPGVPWFVPGPVAGAPYYA